jgi:hypothetical protein
VLNRNRSNLGLCGHVNRVCEMARGEWLIAAAGDDISLPERVEVLADCIRRHPAAAYATSQATTFSDDSFSQADDGNILSEALGATEALRLSVFREFGPLHEDTFSEDWALYFRAQLKGEVIFVERPLVRYRVSERSLTSSFAKGGLRGKVRIHRANLRQFKVDVEKCGPLTQSTERLVNDLATRIWCCDLLSKKPIDKLSYIQHLPEMLTLKRVPWRAKFGLLALLYAPSLYVVSERLRNSRLRLASPLSHAIRYLDPHSLLTSPIPVRLSHYERKQTTQQLFAI